MSADTAFRAVLTGCVRNEVSRYLIDKVSAMKSFERRVVEAKLEAATGRFDSLSIESSYIQLYKLCCLLYFSIFQFARLISHISLNPPVSILRCSSILRLDSHT